MVSFWLTDGSVSEIVLRLETPKGIDDAPLNKYSSLQHKRESAPAPSLPPSKLQQQGQIPFVISVVTSVRNRLARSPPRLRGPGV